MSNYRLTAFIFVFLAIGVYLCKHQKLPVHVTNSIVSSITPKHVIDWNNQQWKTYTNTEGKYSFQYPSNFELHINERYIFESDHKYHPAKNTIELDPPLTGSSSTIFIEHTFFQMPISLDDYIKNNANCTKILETKGQDVVVNKLHGKLFVNMPCGVSGETRLFIINNNIGYNITIDDTYDTYNEAFLKQFLSRFIFTH